MKKTNLPKHFFKRLSKIENVPSLNTRKAPSPPAILFVMILTYFLIFSIFTLMRHYTFKTNAFDLGIYRQALHTTLFEGKFFYETPDLYYTFTGSFFGVHFVPIIFLLLPLYYVFPMPETLLIFQSLIIALPAIPIYYLSLFLSQKKNIAISFAAFYLLNPFIHSLNTYDFHIESFLPLFSTLALYYFETKRWKRFVAFSVLVGMTIDFAAIISLFFGIYGFTRYSKSVLRLILRKKMAKEEYEAVVASFAVFVISVFLLFTAILVISHFGPIPLSSTGVNALFSKLGSNYREIMVNIILEPWRLVDSFLYDAIYKLAYLSAMFLSVFCFAYYSPREIILCAPWIGVTLLTTNGVLYQLGYQFSAFIIPFIMYASIHGVIKIQKHRELLVYKKISKAFVIVFIMGVFISPISPIIYYFTNSVPYGGYPIPTNHTMLLSQAVSLIPKNASVLAQNHIFAHVSDRSNVYLWVPPNVTVDYAIADITQRDYVTFHGINQSFQQQFETLKNSKLYQILFEEDGIIVLKKIGQGEVL